MQQPGALRAAPRLEELVGPVLEEHLGELTRGSRGPGSAPCRDPGRSWRCGCRGSSRISRRRRWSSRFDRPLAPAARGPSWRRARSLDRSAAGDTTPGGAGDQAHEGARGDALAAAGLADQPSVSPSRMSKLTPSTAWTMPRFGPEVDVQVLHRRHERAGCRFSSDAGRCRRGHRRSPSAGRARRAGRRRPG